VPFVGAITAEDDGEACDSALAGLKSDARRDKPALI
jgi:hypothetical protein